MKIVMLKNKEFIAEVKETRTQVFTDGVVTTSIPRTLLIGKDSVEIVDLTHGDLEDSTEASGIAYVIAKSLLTDSLNSGKYTNRVFDMLSEVLNISHCKTWILKIDKLSFTVDVDEEGRANVEGNIFDSINELRLEMPLGSILCNTRKYTISNI